MRDSILHHQPGYSFRHGLRQAHANRPAIILHEQHIAARVQLTDKSHDDFLQMIEGIVKLRRIGRAGVAEPGQVRRDEPVPVREP